MDSTHSPVPPERRIDALLTEAGFSPAMLRGRRDAFRQENDGEIRRVVSALHEHAVLAGVDSTRYRPGVPCELVLEKVAEAVALALRNLRYARQLKERRDTADRARRAQRDGSRRMAMLLRHDDPIAARRYRELSDFYAGIARDWRGKHPRPSLSGYPDLPPSGHLNILVLDLVAILAHLTDLTPYHVLQEHVPEILRVLWDCTDCVPKRGRENPGKRYKDSQARIVSASAALGDDDYATDVDMQLRRACLFVGDDRFPPSLIEPHRTIRTVPRRTSYR